MLIPDRALVCVFELMTLHAAVYPSSQYFDAPRALALAFDLHLAKNTRTYVCPPSLLFMRSQGRRSVARKMLCVQYTQRWLRPELHGWQVQICKFPNHSPISFITQPAAFLLHRPLLCFRISSLAPGARVVRVQPPTT